MLEGKSKIVLVLAIVWMINIHYNTSTLTGALIELLVELTTGIINNNNRTKKIHQHQQYTTYNEPEHL
jgi:hypothetical protein